MILDLFLRTTTEEDLEKVWDFLKESYAQKQKIVLGLSGGTSPLPLYQALAQRLAGTEHQLLKEAIHWVLIDERQVPEEDPESNKGQIQKHLFQIAEISSEKILAFDTTIEAKKACEKMDQALHDLEREQEPGILFDALILGAGTDGHIASLFTEENLTNHFTSNAIETTAPKQYKTSRRLSLTLECLKKSKKVFLLLKGEEKEALWEKLQKGALPNSALVHLLDASRRA